MEWFVRCGFIPAPEVIPRSIFSSVLWPSVLEQYHTRSVAGLNELHGPLGFWNKLLHLDSGVTGISRYVSIGSVLSLVFPFHSSSL